jgi:hypothetical protein
MTISVDTAIFAAIVSAAVSFGIFGLKEKWIEPGRWKKSTEAIKLERKLEIYGTLTTLLQSFHQKTQRVNLQKGTVTTAFKYQHALEVLLMLINLTRFFEKARYLLSDDLITRFMEYIKQDTYHSIFQARKGIGSDVVMVDLKDMQSLAERVRPFEGEV